jgi:hypothetical protein
MAGRSAPQSPAGTPSPRRPGRAHFPVPLIMAVWVFCAFIGGQYFAAVDAAALNVQVVGVVAALGFLWDGLRSPWVQV